MNRYSRSASHYLNRCRYWPTLSAYTVQALIRSLSTRRLAVGFQLHVKRADQTSNHCHGLLKLGTLAPNSELCVQRADGTSDHCHGHSYYWPRHLSTVYDGGSGDSVSQQVADVTVVLHNNTHHPCSTENDEYSGDALSWSSARCNDERYRLSLQCVRVSCGSY